MRKIIGLGLLICSIVLSGCSGMNVNYIIPETEEIAEEHVEESVEKPEDIVPEENTVDVVTDSSADSHEDIFESGESITPGDKIDVIYFMGQSNMSGKGGDALLAPYVPTNEGVEFRAFSDPTKLYHIEEPFGNTENNPNGLEEDDPKGKKGSMVSSFVRMYNKLTGNKVIAVSISKGGMAMDLWLGKSFHNDVIGRIENTNEYLDSHGIKPNKTYIVWLQGESDEARLVMGELYGTYFKEFFYSLFPYNIDEVFVITPSAERNNLGYMGIVEAQLGFCDLDPHFCLATTALRGIGKECYSDHAHVNQHTLNMVGQEAAKAAAFYTLMGRKPVVYNYMTDELFIPKGSEDLANVCLERIDLSNVNETY